VLRVAQSYMAQKMEVNEVITQMKAIVGIIVHELRILNLI